MEYPTECKDCGFLGEEEVFLSGNIDLIAGGGAMTWCPACQSDHVVFHKPKEDRDEARWELLSEQDGE